VSQAADTAGLKSADDIVQGLRLDYWLGEGATRHVAFKAGEINDIVAIRFKTETPQKIEIPDLSNRSRVDELRYDRSAAERTNAPDRPEDVERAKAEAANAHGDDIKPDEAAWPNTGHGFTSSRVHKSPVVPELKVNQGTALDPGAEMWRINKAGQEVLIGRFDGERWIRV
jgi:hypothetical protein